jgi:small GTP-binding protein
VSERRIVIGVFGIDGAGKTCFLHSLVGDFDFDSIVPTVGLGQKTIHCRNRTVTIYGLGGSARFRSVWPRFFAEVWGFFYVIDAADSARFAEAVEVLEPVKTHPMMAGKPFVVVANKQDCAGALRADALRSACGIPGEVRIFEAVATAVSNGRCHRGVEAAVGQLVDEIKQREAELAEKTAEDMRKQSQIEEQERAAKQHRREGTTQ